MNIDQRPYYMFCNVYYTLEGKNEAHHSDFFDRITQIFFPWREASLDLSVRSLFFYLHGKLESS